MYACTYVCTYMCACSSTTEYKVKNMELKFTQNYIFERCMYVDYSYLADNVILRRNKPQSRVSIQEDVGASCPDI